MASQPAVYIVDDDPVVRISLHGILTEAGFPARVFKSADEFLEEFEPDWQGCLLLDMQMPGLPGLELQRLLAQRGSPLSIIILTATAIVATAVETMRLGAVDLIEKPCPPERLLTRVRSALAMSAAQVALRQERQLAAERWDILSLRERQVAELVVRGLANKQIAAQLSVSEKTVEAHRAQVMRKMQTDGVAALVRLVLLIAERPQTAAEA